MNQKMMKKLEAIMDSYGEKDDDDSAMLNQTAFAISDGKGTWTKDGNPFKVMWHNLDGATKRTSNAIFYWDNEEDGLVGIKRLNNGKLYAFNDADFECPITNPELIAIIETLAGISKAAKLKPKAKKAGKKFKVVYKESGDLTKRPNPNKRRTLGVYDTRKKAIEALKQDMQDYKNLWEDDTAFVETGWNVVISSDYISARCEWDVKEVSS